MAGEAVTFSKMSRPRALGMGAFFGFVVLAILHVLVTSRLMGAAGQLRAQVAKQEDKFRESESLIRQSPAIDSLYLQRGNDLIKLMETQLVSGDNYVAWVSSAVEEAASQSGVKVKSISGAGTLRMGTEPAAGEKAEVATLEDFQASIELQCTYHEFGRFLATLEQRYPHSRLDTVSLRAASDRNPDSGLEVSLRYGFARLTDDGFQEKDRPSKEGLEALVGTAEKE